MPKITRALLPLLFVVQLIVTAIAIKALPAGATNNGPTFVVMNTSESPPDGVWFRNSPHSSDTDRVTGHGVYMNDTVRLSCYAWGDAVGPYADRLWYYVYNLTRPTVPGTSRSNEGYLNAHYINDGKAANVVDPGVPMCGSTPPPPPPPPSPAPTTNFNIHWSGYAITGHRYDDVKGSWVEPAVKCSTRQNTDSVFFVGLDSYPSGPLEQIGTESACRSGGPVYKAWYELTPAKAVVLANLPVSPGDALTGEVTTNFDGKFTLTLNDTSKGWSYSVNRTSTAGSGAGGYSAEWIAEAPQDFGGGLVAPLANFGTVQFTGCIVNGVPISKVFSTKTELVMQSGSTMKAQPSGLGSDGQSFSVTWHHS